jgi:HEAT repeat protein
MGRIRSFDAEDLLIANADKDSFYNQIRSAAIAALAKRNDPKAFEIAYKYAAYGHDDRLRPVAIRALGRLARNNPSRRDEVRAALARWLTDPQDRSLMAAIEALADMADAESQSLIRQRLAGAIKPDIRHRAEDALARARPEAESETMESLRKQVRELREKLYDLAGAIDRIESAR